MKYMQSPSIPHLYITSSWRYMTGLSEAVWRKRIKNLKMLKFSWAALEYLIFRTHNTAEQASGYILKDARSFEGTVTQANIYFLSQMICEKDFSVKINLRRKNFDCDIFSPTHWTVYGKLHFPWSNCSGIGTRNNQEVSVLIELVIFCRGCILSIRALIPDIWAPV